MQSYKAVITITIDDFEANNEDHADDISAIFVNRILQARISDSSEIKIHSEIFLKDHLDSTTHSHAALEIQTLRALAEDLYITLVNEVGSTTAGKNYQDYLENVSGSPIPR